MPVHCKVNSIDDGKSFQFQFQFFIDLSINLKYNLPLHYTTTHKIHYQIKITLNIDYKIHKKTITFTRLYLILID